MEGETNEVEKILLTVVIVFAWLKFPSLRLRLMFYRTQILVLFE